MKILVANLGSTSFKYRLFDIETETQLAKGGIDRIGEKQSKVVVEIGNFSDEMTQEIPDHAAAVRICLEQLTDSENGCLGDVSEVAAIGFKAVVAGTLSGTRYVNEELLQKMESLTDIAPAHNPPYVRAMRELATAFPNLPLVASLETGFHETIPAKHRHYAVPCEWYDKHEVRKWGYHGASHRYIGGRVAELIGKSDLKVVSCHLGGSNSLCAIRDGKSVAHSMGMSPQTGLPHNNRVGDFDAFALPVLMRATGKSLEVLLDELANQSGLLGVSGLSGDVRDLEEAAANGHEKAKLALDIFTAAIRQYLGGFAALLGGLDAVVFTGGIGENSQFIREQVCKEMEWAGMKLDASKNENLSDECSISNDDSQVEVWVIPTNEELVVARETAAVLSS